MILVNRFLKICGVAFFCTILVNVHANNISFDQPFYADTAGSQISVTVTYDFTSQDLFGGSFNLIYDPEVLEFISYTQAEYTGGLQGPTPAASPLGELESPGNYIGPGVGTFEDFFGISNAGDIGTFVFVLLSNNSSTTPCGATMCLTPNAQNPFVSLFGDIVDDEIFSNGIAAANVRVVPLPATVWLFISALGVAAVKGRKKSHGSVFRSL